MNLTFPATVESIDEVNLATPLTMNFIIDHVASPIMDNQNPYSAAAFTEVGDGAGQMSSWFLSGMGTEVYAWTLTFDGTLYWVNLYADLGHTTLVAQGSRTTANGVVYFKPYTDFYTLAGQVTIAYTVDDADAANEIYCNNLAATETQGLLGSSEFMYKENHGLLVKYTVNETVSAIDALINGAYSFLEVTYDLTTAQITALGATAVQIIAAPGANYVLEFISGIANYDYDTAQYSVNTTINLIYGTSLNVLAAAATAVAGAADKITRFISTGGVAHANESLKLKMNGAVTVGAGAVGTCKVTITYKVTHI